MGDPLVTNFIEDVQNATAIARAAEVAIVSAAPGISDSDLENRISALFDAS